MANYQRMIALPQEEYLQLSSVQNVRQPLTQQFYNVEKEYVENENINDPYRRMIFQSENMEQMKQLKDQMRHYISITTPKPYLNRAQALLQSVDTFVKYNARGEIFDDENNVIPNSRMEDLIQHAVRDRRRNMVPAGWEYFLNQLRSHNVPKSILNRDTLDEMDNIIFPTVTKEIKQEHSPPKKPRKATKPTKRLSKPSLKNSLRQRPLKLNSKFLGFELSKF